MSQYLYVCQVLYAFAIALTKIAIISSYLRFIQHRGFRLTMYATLVLIVGLWVTGKSRTFCCCVLTQKQAGVFVPIFQCAPIAGAWDFSITRSCIDYISYLYASSAVNILTDIVLCILPMPHLWRLSMPLKQRVVLCVLFAGGASACLVGIARIGYLHTLRVLDTSYQSVPCLVLSVGECSLGIISVSIPALRPIAQRLFPSTMRTNPASSSQGRSWRMDLRSVPAGRARRTASTEDKVQVSVSQESLTWGTG